MSSTNAQISTLKVLLDATQKCNYLFGSYDGTSIDLLIKYQDTENVTSMSNMFQNCANLTTIPLLDTHNVTQMSSLFSGCTNLISIPLLDTSNITSMNNFFQNCTNLTTIPLLDTSNVTSMTYTFRYCSSLTSIPAINVNKVTSPNGFNSAFQGCSNLQEIHMINIRANLNISFSTLFTRDALNEIIGNLVDVGASRTLTIGATNLAKLTSDDIAVATAKGWTIA